MRGLSHTIDPYVLAATKQQLQMFDMDASKLLNSGFHHNIKQFGLTLGGSTDVVLVPHRKAKFEIQLEQKEGIIL